MSETRETFLSNKETLKENVLIFYHDKMISKELRQEVNTKFCWGINFPNVN